MFERLITLINEDNLNKLKKANILIVGLGGVGGYALETLVRSGIHNLTIVDGDVVELSNLNRQIISKQSVIGKPKALVAKERALEISPEINLKVINEFITNDNFSLLNIDSYDYVIDACDDLNLKMLLIKNADKYKLISSMGTANKMDMTKFKITTIDKTSYDPLAKIIRKKIKDEKIKTKFKVVSSDEKVIKNGTKLGTIAYMPATSGLLCASYVINDIIKTISN
ncbi:MAG: ThiF family adenylyltransferase [bacterium]|nr:ThiF family adenylyltransferase [bacterium]